MPPVVTHKPAPAAPAPQAPPLGSPAERTDAISKHLAPPPAPPAPAVEPAAAPVAAPAPPAPPAAPAAPESADRVAMRLDAEIKRLKKESASALEAQKKLDAIRQRVLADPKGAIEDLGAAGAVQDVYRRLLYQLAPDADPEKLTPDQKEIRETKAKLAEFEKWKQAQDERLLQERAQRRLADKRAEVAGAIARDPKYRGFLALAAEDRVLHEMLNREDGQELTASEALDMLLPEAEQTGDRLAADDWFRGKAIKALREAGYTITEPGKTAATAGQPKLPAADPVQTIDSQTAAARPAGSRTDEETLNDPFASPSEKNAAAMRLAGIK